ncbi:hypothetical protein AB6A40_003865 [Gnathostoma spinigerum]|uniref:Uncharacterized protein n=1 Tax=Gnathostoma spinigerum TaxID=75299 RepID=A0ABD6EIE4_9BILA
MIVVLSQISATAPITTALPKSFLHLQNIEELKPSAVIPTSNKYGRTTRHLLVASWNYLHIEQQMAVIHIVQRARAPPQPTLLEICPKWLSSCIWTYVCKVNVASMMIAFITSPTSVTFQNRG